MPQTIHDWVLRHASARPAAIAVEQGDETLTYRELVAAARAAGAELIGSGLRPGDVVLVAAPRSLAMVVTLLGVLLAGGAYIAADERWPRSTLRRAYGTAAVTVRLGDAGRDAELPGSIHWPDEVSVLGDRRCDVAGWPVIQASGPCCVFFTAGSTGEPKGVLAVHRGTLTRFRDVSYAPFDEKTVTLQASALPWDGLSLELWGPLMHGGRVVLPETGSVTPDLLRLAQGKGVNTLWLTSSLFNGIVEDDVSSLGGFRQIMTGGERISVPHVRKFVGAHPGRTLLSGYGPVETTAFATTYPLTTSSIEGLDDIPLGFVLPRTTVTVRDDTRCVVPAGVVGEIYIGGEGLAAGYLEDPQLTAARFVTVEAERLYRTGDFGWFDQAGRLRFAGRRDRQVKIHGNRVELNAVEDAMRAVPGVAAAFAVVDRSIYGASMLTGHYTTVDGTERSDAVLAACADRLPGYSVPRRLRHHDRLPLNSYGKVDARALAEDGTVSPAPVSDVPEVARLQQIVAAIQGRQVGADEDLVDSGLDSLSAMRIAYQVSVAFHVVFEISDLYRLRSLSAVAAQLAGQPRTSWPDSDDTELTAAQLDWWLREQIRPGDPGALVACAFRIVVGEISALALADAVRILADQHLALRTRIAYTPAGPRLARIGGAAPDVLRAEDDLVDVASGLPETWYRRFDLERDAAWRVCLGREASGRQVLALVLHHMLVDGWSESLLVSELGRAWRIATGQMAAGPPGRPRATRIRPVRARPDSKLYWARELAGMTRLDVRPTGPPPGPRVGRWYLRLTAINGQTSDLIDKILAERPAAEALQARLLAAWAGALSASGQHGRYIIGVAYAGRDRVSADELGCFVEMLPVAIESSAGPAAFGADVARRWLGALDHRSLPLPEILAAAGGQRGGNALQSVFVLQSNPPPKLDLGAGIEAERLELRTRAPLYPIALEVWPHDDDYIVRLEWDRDQVDDSWAQLMRPHYAAAVTDLGFRHTDLDHREAI